MARFISLLLLVGAAACVPEGGEWKHGPVQLSPTPVELRPPFPLNPGDVRVLLCLGMPATFWAAAPEKPDSSGIRLSDGRVLRIGVDVRTAGGKLWAHDRGHFRARHQRAEELCFAGTAGPSDFEPPRYTKVELSSTIPLQVTYVQWRAAAFGSL